MSQAQILSLLKKNKGKKFTTTEITEVIGGKTHNNVTKCNKLYFSKFVKREYVKPEGKMRRFVFWV